MTHLANPPKPPPARDTHVYKVVDGREIALDVIGACPGADKRCVVWIHGGGLIFGSRTISPRASFLQLLLDRGVVVVSIDHRLAPEARLPDILDDVRDAWRWVHLVGAERFGVDPGRIAMAGASAGAYLSLMAGCLFEPRPRALASFWGFGDIIAPWEAQPSEHYRQMDLVTREAALASLQAPAVYDAAVGVDRSTFYLYCRQQGQWLQELTGRDPLEDAVWFDRYCPSRNISPAFPPTILVHGTVDTDVPHAESAGLVDALAGAGVHYRFLSLLGVGHGFAGAQPETIQQVESEVTEFLCARLG